MKKLFFIYFVLISFYANAQFIGDCGVYYLGTANVPINTTVFANPNISGVVVRFLWKDIETAPDNFDWKFVDNEIDKAKTYNKKVSLQPLGIPDWMNTTGALQYYYIDKNTAHTTYGQLLSDVIPWDNIYVSRYKNFLQKLASKYSSNSTISYINTIGGAFSRNLPDTVITDKTLLSKQAFWKAYNYNADSFGALINEMTDYYMSLFPKTPLWCSVDYVSFELKASNRPQNYLAAIITSYGISHYSDRFGLFREDLAGCNPPTNINTGNQWYILQQNPCRTGAQMLWNVQDGPTRMNKCGIIPSNKSTVLDSAVNKGLSLGMRYMEIYGVDINDITLNSNIQKANDKLKLKETQCNSSTGIKPYINDNDIVIYPNPTNDFINIKIPGNKYFDESVYIYNLVGQLLIRKVINTGISQINISKLPKGLYIIRFQNQSYKSQLIIKS